HRMSAMVVAAVLVAGTVVLPGGPVAALIGGGYAAAAVGAWCGRQRARVEADAVAFALDGIALLAADLRAGVPAETALAHALPALRASPVADGQRVAAQVDAAG